MELTKTSINLVPDTANTTPDYFCTWQTQLYACNNTGPQGQRDVLGEAFLLDSARPLGCAHFYPQARKDLFFVMDDSWDVPIGGTRETCDKYGSQQLDRGKFPSFAGESVANRDALRQLSDAIRRLGWRGLGGWICAEKAADVTALSEEAFFAACLQEAAYADWKYWKVDWGKQGENVAFRRMLNRLKATYAPSLVVEQAMLPELIPESDVFRTYDVPALMSIPMTMEKLEHALKYDAVGDHSGLIDCEDEVYIAAALGCCMGVMRHPMVGCLPNGEPDPSFPAMHRNIKTKMDEVIRAVRWHRIAPAFSVNGTDTHIHPQRLTDTWRVHNQTQEIEAWWGYKNGDMIQKDGPVVISRRLPLPTVQPDMDGDIPFVVAAENPNGAVSIATLGRTLDRRWKSPRCSVTLEAQNASLFGIFGEYENLCIHTTAAQSGCTVLAQDLMDENAMDITQWVSVQDGRLLLPGELLHRIGTMAGHPDDTSEPGLVVRIIADTTGGLL